MVCRFEMTLKQSDDRIDLYGFDDVVMKLNALQEIEFGFGYGSVIGGRREGDFFSLNSWEQRKLRRYFSADPKFMVDFAIFHLTPNSHRTHSNPKIFQQNPEPAKETPPTPNPHTMGFAHYWPR